MHSTRPTVAQARTRGLATAGLALAASALLTACGHASASHTSPTPRTSTHHGRATPSPATAKPVDVASIYGMAVPDVETAALHFLPGGTRFTLTSDAQFMNQPSTDQRFYRTADGEYQLEIDVVPEGYPSQAATDYPTIVSYTSSDLSDIQHSTPSIGDQADEYTGQVQAGAGQVAVDAISFREGATDAMVFWISGNGVIVPAIGEAIATALDHRVSAVVYPPGACGKENCIARFEGTTDASNLAASITTAGWYEVEHFTYPRTGGAACELDSWSIAGADGPVTISDPATALSIARSASSETDYLKPGRYTITFTTDRCFWRILVVPATSPFGQ